jgi:hypothetical protein
MNTSRRKKNANCPHRVREEIPDEDASGVCAVAILLVGQVVT